MDDTPSPPAKQAPDLNVERTRLAHERTMMAWIRTALSLIGFGFTLYTLARTLGDQAPAAGGGWISPRVLGTIMISMGLATLLMATLQHRASMKQLRREAPDLPLSLSAITAGMIALLGFLALAAVVLGS
jgi:putative membrane protein